MNAVKLKRKKIKHCFGIKVCIELEFRYLLLLTAVNSAAQLKFLVLKCGPSEHLIEQAWSRGSDKGPLAAAPFCNYGIPVDGLNRKSLYGKIPLK